MSLAVRAGEVEWQAHVRTGTAAYQRGDYRGAVASFAAALKEAEAFGEADQRFALTLNNLAFLHQSQGHYAQAEPLFKRSLAIREKALGPEHPHVATSLENISRLYTKMEKMDAAKQFADRAAKIRALKR